MCSGMTVLTPRRLSVRPRRKRKEIRKSPSSCTEGRDGRCAEVSNGSYPEVDTEGRRYVYLRLAALQTAAAECPKSGAKRRVRAERSRDLRMAGCCP